MVPSSSAGHLRLPVPYAVDFGPLTTHQGLFRFGKSGELFH